MGCPPTPLSCLEPSNIFAGVYNPNCGGFADPTNFQAEQAIFGSGFQELINNYGIEVNYFVNGFNLSAMNVLYGEHSTQEYSGPHVIKSYIELEESVSLSQFGMESDDELTAYIAIKDFTDLFALSADIFTDNGQRVEPKSDDLMEITALGCNRPGDRGAKIFRITEVLDQNTSIGLNPAMGHYVWAIKAKRYETSYETNAPMESGNEQVYDNTFSGKLSSALFPSLSTEEKAYPGDIDVISQEDVYDMDNVDNDVYGDYY
tara:strand:- start:22901 stop:23683 length:783 start_codon:yes stop_codon:yes gene_type:complete